MKVAVGRRPSARLVMKETNNQPSYIIQALIRSVFRRKGCDALSYPLITRRVFVLESYHLALARMKIKRKKENEKKRGGAKGRDC